MLTKTTRILNEQKRNCDLQKQKKTKKEILYRNIKALIHLPRRMEIEFSTIKSLFESACVVVVAEAK